MNNLLNYACAVSSLTGIHNTFIEKYMLNANGSFVKVYLFLAKCIQARESFSISSLADRMESTENDIIRALNYWEKKELIQITKNTDGVITGLFLTDPDRPGTSSVFASTPVETAASPTAQAVSPQPNPSDMQEVLPASRKPATASTSAHGQQLQYSFCVSDEQRRALASDDSLEMLLKVVSTFYGRPLRPNETQTIIYLYSELHFSEELIIHLYEHCVELGKTKNSYVQKVAISWHEKQVKNVEDARNVSANFNAGYNQVSRAFALGRALSPAEIRYVDRWLDEWGMDLSVILEACNRTILKLQHGDFKYCDGVLDKWHKENVRTLQDIQEADERYERKRSAQRSAQSASQTTQKRPPYHNFSQHGLSSDEADSLEKKLLHAN